MWNKRFLFQKQVVFCSRKIEINEPKIIHRGPDEDGFCEKNNDDVTIGMAMRRLSIIDLTSESNLFYSNDKQKVILFNGEI